MADLLAIAHRALLEHGCGVTHEGELVFCDDARLPDSCRIFDCQYKRDAEIVVKALEAQA